MLGVPLGNDSFVSGFVVKKLLGRLQDTVNRLVEFEDTQAATYLLRVSFSIVRAVHFMRTTPLDQWREQASKFDGMIRAVGFPMDDPTFAQASLTPRWVGLVFAKWLSMPTWLIMRAGMKPKRWRKKSGLLLPICLLNTSHSKMPLLSSMKRCTNIWLIKLTLAEHSA